MIDKTIIPYPVILKFHYDIYLILENIEISYLDVDGPILINNIGHNHQQLYKVNKKNEILW